MKNLSKKVKCYRTFLFIPFSLKFSQLLHPHIVQFIGIYINDSNEQYIVTEVKKNIEKKNH